MFSQVRQFGSDDLEQVLEAKLWHAPSQLFLRNQASVEVERVRSAIMRAPSGRFWGSMTREGPDFGAFFGVTRVACLGPGTREHGAKLRRVTLGAERGFRILIGSSQPALGLLEALGDRIQIEMQRSQPFLVVEDAAALGEGIEIRPGLERDLAWLMDASVRLNEEDLGIPARSVDRRVLERRVRDRIRQASTWIVEDAGKAVCKLEIGNDGPAGSLIEGVFTEEAVRGRGFARKLCAEVARRQLQRRCRVGLHVSRANDRAFRAYRAAGFREVEDLVLALIAWV